MLVAPVACHPEVSEAQDPVSIVPVLVVPESVLPELISPESVVPVLVVPVLVVPVLLSIGGSTLQSSSTGFREITILSFCVVE